MKFFIAVPLVALLASCSKPAPEPTAKALPEGGQEVRATDPGYKEAIDETGGLILSLDSPDNMKAVIHLDANLENVPLDFGGKTGPSLPDFESMFGAEGEEEPEVEPTVPVEEKVGDIKANLDLEIMYAPDTEETSSGICINVVDLDLFVTDTFDIENVKFSIRAEMNDELGDCLYLDFSNTNAKQLLTDIVGKLGLGISPAIINSVLGDGKLMISFDAIMSVVNMLMEQFGGMLFGGSEMEPEFRRRDEILEPGEGEEGEEMEAEDMIDNLLGMLQSYVDGFLGKDFDLADFLNDFFDGNSPIEIKTYGEKGQANYQIGLLANLSNDDIHEIIEKAQEESKESLPEGFDVPEETTESNFDLNKLDAHIGAKVMFGNTKGCAVDHIAMEDIDVSARMSYEEGKGEANLTVDCAYGEAAPYTRLTEQQISGYTDLSALLTALLGYLFGGQAA